MYKCILSSVLLLSAISLNAQHIHKLSFHDHLELRLQQVDVQSLMFSRTAMIPGYTPVIEADSGDKSSLLVEMGYIATQQAAFLGLSYLASRKHGAGPVVATGFDVFTGGTGILNMAPQETILRKVGYLALSTGCFIKSYYTLRGSSDHSEKQRFVTSYLSYNVLVYCGYFLHNL